MESNDKQAGMPIWKAETVTQSIGETGDFDSYVCISNGKLKFVLVDDNDDDEDAIEKIVNTLNGCPPPKSEAEVEEEIRKLVKQKVNDHLVKHVDVEKGDTRCRVDIMCEQISKELSRLLSAPSKGKYSEWISVEDGLPDEEQRVLCYGKGDRIFTAIYKNGAFWAMGWDGEPRTFDVDDAADFIKFWQPLPEAPRIF